MNGIQVRIRPERDLSFFTISVLLIYYLPPLFRAFSVAALTIVIIKNISDGGRLPVLPISAGFLLGAVLSITLHCHSEGAFAGLPHQRIEKIVLQVSEDSFLSGDGRLIIRGEVREVRGFKREECGARGTVLLIGGKTKDTFMQGEILMVEAGLAPFADSRELAFIAYGGKDISRLGWVSELYKFRKKMIDDFDRISSRMPHRVEALFRALFRGNSDNLERDLKKKFRKSGVPHLLALSGFHVAVLVLILTGVLSRFIGSGIASLSAIPFIIAYLVFAGGSPSLTRAVLMFSMASLGKSAGYRIKPVPLLMLSCLLQLVLWPVQGWSLSFQLSYLALWGLVVLGKRISSALDSRIPPLLNLPLSASLGAHLATAPLLVFLFGELYPVGILSSIVLTPLVILFMWGSLGAYIVHFPGEGSLLGGLSDRIGSVIYDLIDHLVMLFSRFPAIVFSGVSSVLLYFILIALVVLWLYRHVWRIYGRAEKSQFKLRFTIGNQSATRADGTWPEKEMEPEFSDKQKCQRETGRCSSNE